MMKPHLFALALAACGGGGNAPNVSITAAMPEALAPADDSRDDLTITARYDDGDGDLGNGIAEIHDCRADGLVTELPIPAIAPDSIEGEHITGTLELHVNDIGALAGPAAIPPACSELGIGALAESEAVFCVILVDAAGNSGDGDCTATITLE